MLIARLLFVALLYLFLFAIMKTGVGLVRGQRKKERTVERGRSNAGRGACGASPSSVRGPVVVGRTPGAGHRSPEPVVSGTPCALCRSMGQNLFIEDLGSTNGTSVNGQPIAEPTALKNNDVVNVGDVAIRVRFA